MRAQKPLSRNEMLAVGLLMAAFGVFFILIGIGVVAPPGGKKSLHAPLWVVLLAGLVFALGAAAFLMHIAAGGNGDDRDLPRNAPYWMRVVQYVVMVTIFGSFAMIGTWIAFGPGERNISMSLPFVSLPAGEIVGRAAFGIGAAITWLCTLAVAAKGVRKLREKA